MINQKLLLLKNYFVKNNTLKNYRQINNKKLNNYLTLFNKKNYKLKKKTNQFNLIKIYNFISLILLKKGKILFILPESYNNDIFIHILNKTKHFYIFGKNNKPGSISNFLNLKNKKTNLKKLPDLVFILNTNYKQINTILKESMHLKIPIISIINYELNFSITNFKLVGDINHINLKFYYLFLSKILLKYYKK